MQEHSRVPGPAEIYERKHPPAKNVNKEFAKKQSPGSIVADKVASLVGSWPFIITQSCFLAMWMAANAYLVVMLKTRPEALKAWDPYPFILLNLVLSFQAAYTGPVVMMSQNRQNEKDRLAAEHDYQVNERAELEIEVVMKHLVHQDKLILEAIHHLEELRNSLPEMQGAEKMHDTLQKMEERDRQIVALMDKLGKS